MSALDRLTLKLARNRSDSDNDGDNDASVAGDLDNDNSEGTEMARQQGVAENLDALNRALEACQQALSNLQNLIAMDPDGDGV